MRLATWNVNSLRARLPRVLEFLAEHRPDVLCLQETKCDPDRFPHAAFADAGYTAVDHSGGRWAGVAIAARADLELAVAATGLPGEPQPEEARWIEATVDGIDVCSVYVPNGRALDSEWYRQKLDFLAAMHRRAAALRRGSSAPLVIAGDLNVAPADLDVYDPAAFAASTHTSGAERAALARLGDAGLIDTFRHLHPDAVGYTWWDYRQGHFHRGLGLRIDLIFATAEIAEQLVSVGIEREYRKGRRPSDHAPLVAVWERRAHRSGG